MGHLTFNFSESDFLYGVVGARRLFASLSEGSRIRGPKITINTKIFAIQKNFSRGIHFVKITKNIFQSTRLPEERMGVTEKIGGHKEFP